MAPSRRADVRGELKRLGLALNDMKVAAALCDVLEERDSIDGRDWGEVAEGLWTGLVVTYVRPFTRGGLCLFEDRLAPLDDEGLLGLHAELQMLRDRVFAHNDNTGHRLPTIGFNDRIEPATANLNLGGLVFVTSRIPAVRDLVTAQRARLEARGDVLLAELVELYPFDRWLTDIDAIPD